MTEQTVAPTTNRVSEQTKQTIKATTAKPEAEYAAANTPQTVAPAAAQTAGRTGHTYYTDCESPVGTLLLTSDGTALTGLYMGEHRHGPTVAPDWIADDNALPFADAKAQLAAYFAGTRTAFLLPLSPQGTDFQKRVWEELRRIPHGETVSYGELARRIGSPNACRAVGLANGRNPISIIVPCHRVIGANGKLVGYGGGLSRKEILLAVERAAPEEQAHQTELSL